MSSHVSLVTFKFEHFERLPCNPSAQTLSKKITDVNNNEWAMAMFPGGDEPLARGEDREKRNMAFFLSKNESTYDIGMDARFCIIIRNKHGHIFHLKHFSSYDNGHGLGSDELAKRCVLTEYRNERLVGYGGNSVTRSEILDKANNILHNEALYVECLIQIKHKVDFELMHTKGHFYFPPNPVALDTMDLLTSVKHSHVSFAIGDEIFRLHEHVLTERAPVLANMCGGADKDEYIQLSGMTVGVFRIMLRYIYLGDPPKAQTVLELGEEIIRAGDYLGVEGLKMLAETALVASRVINLSNVVDYLFLADAKTCPLLKEYAVQYIIARPRELHATKSYEKLMESSKLRDEIFVSVADKVTVDELRRMLDKNSLDVHGSKETLISRLEKHTNQMIWESE